MRILASWLRDYVEFGDIYELAHALTMSGFEVSAIESPPPGMEGAGEDAVLDLEITTNRPDCLGVIGIAREVSTIYNTSLLIPDDENNSISDSNLTTKISIEDEQLCPRYAAALEKVSVGPSPSWLAARLNASGIRPINNIVDVTNYVMLELGHPMHAFDFECLDGHQLRIRCAHDGENIRTLDGKNRDLKTDILVIADANRPQAIAGVIGGADSEVSSSTKIVILESAYFEPNSIRHAGKYFSLSTEASYRFERGTDINIPVTALHRARKLLKQIGAAESDGPIIDRYQKPRTLHAFEFRHQQIARILGININETFVVTTLEHLGFSVQCLDSTPGETRWKITVPSHRVDITREIDLIEEVARHYGYDRLPSTFPALVEAPAKAGNWLSRQQLLSKILTASGCSESINYSFIERDVATAFTVKEAGKNTSDSIVSIANPLSENFSVLRPSLLPGLIDSLIRNRRRGHLDIRLFEIGKRFTHLEGETEAVAVAISGVRTPEHWSSESRDVDFFDAKGITESLCDALGIIPTFEPTVQNFLVPGRATLVRGTKDEHCTELGYLGQLEPELAINRGFPSTGGPIYIFELSLDALDIVSVDRNNLQTKSIPRHPSITRDIAIVIDASLSASTVRDTIQASAPNTLVSVREFDYYDGKGVPKGCVSLALHLNFRASDRTLTDEEVQKAMATVIRELELKHNAKLR